MAKDKFWPFLFLFPPSCVKEVLRWSFLAFNSLSLVSLFPPSRAQIKRAFLDTQFCSTNQDNSKISLAFSSALTEVKRYLISLIVYLSLFLLLFLLPLTALYVIKNFQNCTKRLKTHDLKLLTQDYDLWLLTYDIWSLQIRPDLTSCAKLDQIGLDLIIAAVAERIVIMIPWIYLATYLRNYITM